MGRRGEAFHQEGEITMKHRLGFALVLGAVMLFALAVPVGAQDSLTVSLAAQNNSGESGTAQLTDMGGGKTRVVLALSGAPNGVAQPVHIHEGTCATLNPTPKYPLTNLANGKSETVVDVSMSELLSKPYAINAHKSAQEVSVYVTCGNIVHNAAAAAPAGTNAAPSYAAPSTTAPLATGTGGGTATTQAPTTLPATGAARTGGASDFRLLAVLLLTMGVIATGIALRRRAARQ